MTHLQLADVDDDSLRQRARRWRQSRGGDIVHSTLRTAKDSLPSAWRLLTSPSRHLPTAVIVGAKRAGTRRLYAGLLQHPRCFGASEKEIDYFSDHADRSLAWYRSRFPWRRRVWHREGQVLEVSPSYLPTPTALRQMKKTLPHARLIVILRDPVARAFAHFQHEHARYTETRSFKDAVQEEIDQGVYAACRGAALAPDASPMLGYVARGYYALQLELLFKVYSRNKILLVDAARLSADLPGTCNRVFDFLGLEAFKVASPAARPAPERPTAADPRLAAQLLDHYGPHDQLLAELLDESFSWMTHRKAA